MNQGIGTVPNREVQKDKAATNVSRFAAIADLDTDDLDLENEMQIDGSDVAERRVVRGWRKKGNETLV